MGVYGRSRRRERIEQPTGPTAEHLGAHGLGETVQQLHSAVEANQRMMVLRDGAPHLHIRRQASPSFSPQLIDARLPAIRRTINELVEELKPRGSMDLVKDFSFELPLLVITEFLGFPKEDRTRIQAWSKPLAIFTSPPPGADMAEVGKQTLKASSELRTYLSEHINERRQHPGDDPLSQMIQGGSMTHDELVANTLVIVTAGHVTTTDQLSNGIFDLLSNPEQLEMLRSNHQLITPAVEEMLRYNPAAPFIGRIVARDFELHGKQLKQGQFVLLGMAAANRDPSEFPHPDRFDITRQHQKQRHHSFAFGPHHCLGAGLARRELMLGTEILLEQMPGLRLSDPPPSRKPQGFIFRGFSSLNVSW